MRYLKVLLVGLLLALPVLAAADAADRSGSAVWYFHIDLEQMRNDGPGQSVYAWLQDEAFSDIRGRRGRRSGQGARQHDGVFAARVEGPVILFEGNFSQETRDKIMAFIAAGGDLNPIKASAKPTIISQAQTATRSLNLSDGDNIEIRYRIARR